MVSVPLSELAVSNQWQANFLAVLPAVRTHATIQFRHLRPERREEAVQEAIASTCVSYQLLACQGKLQAVRPSTLADFAVKAVKGLAHQRGNYAEAANLIRRAIAGRKLHECGRNGCRFRSATETTEHWVILYDDLVFRVGERGPVMVTINIDSGNAKTLVGVLVN